MNNDEFDFRSNKLVAEFSALKGSSQDVLASDSESTGKRAQPPDAPDAPRDVFPVLDASEPDPAYPLAYEASLDGEIVQKATIFDKPILSPEANPCGTDCIVVIYTRDSAPLGKRFILETSPITVGRGNDRDIVLDGDSVSRLHAHLERRVHQWWIVDDGSTNGTYVNDACIDKEHPLSNGDRITIGPTIFKYLTGQDVEAKYHEEIYQMTIVDGLTQAYVKRYLLESLDEEFIRSRRNRTELSLLIVDIDHLIEINESHGQEAGDFLRREVVGICMKQAPYDEVLPQRPMTTVCATVSGEAFAILLSNTTLENAATLADALREKVATSRLVFRNELLLVTVSIGVASLANSDRTSMDLIKRAGQALYVAKRDGRNCVRRDSPEGTSEITVNQTYRPLLDGSLLVTKALALGGERTLVAFELDDEAAIVEQLGANTYEESFRLLIRSVELATTGSDLIGTWRGRYVLATAPSVTADAITDRIRTAWAKRSVPSEEHRALGKLRFAQLRSEEVARLGDRSLAVLTGRLLRPPVKALEPEDELPFPIAAVRAMVATRRTSLSRVRALLDSVQMVLRFAYAIELAVIGECDASTREAAAEVIVEHEMRGRPWENAILGLAQLVPSSENSAFRAMASAVTRIGRTSTFHTLLDALPSLRTSIAHESSLSEDAHAHAGMQVRELFDALVTALLSLSTTRLVSVADIEALNADDDAIQYALHLHRGPGEHFPIVSESLPARLLKNWCYVLQADLNRPPICLAPLVLSKTCDICGRIEVAIAEEPSWGPKGAAVRARGVTTTHEAQIEVPALSKGMLEMREAVRNRLNDHNTRVIPASSAGSRAAALELAQIAGALSNSYGADELKTMLTKRSVPHTTTRRRVRILFLAANPLTTPRLDLEQELRMLVRELESTDHGRQIELIAKHATNPDDLLRHVRKQKPNIVHFSGHGGTEGIVLRSDTGTEQNVSGASLKQFFANRGVYLVVLNACFSMEQAKEIASSVRAVVGTTSAVDDEAARRFSVAFYRTLGEGHAIREAFRDGCDAVALHGLADTFGCSGELDRSIFDIEDHPPGF